jgi:hypothetical protein
MWYRLFPRLWMAWYAWGLRRSVRRLGWTGVYVGDYASIPTWVYTVGLDETLNHPELIIFDIRQCDANNILWETFESLRSGVLVLEDRLMWPGAGDHPMVWRKVHPSNIDAEQGWFTFALRRRFERTRRNWGLEAFQLVLSDGDGHLPWDEGYDERLRKRQPALWDPAEPALEPLAADASV